MRIIIFLLLQCGRFVTYAPPVYYPPVQVVKEVVVKEVLTPVAVYVPLYTNTIVNAPPVVQQKNSCTEEIEKLKKEIQALKQGNLTYVGHNNNKDHLQILKNECMSCHSGSHPKGGFTLFDSGGNLMNLNARQKNQVITMITTEQMPPNRPLSPSDQNVIVGYLD